MQVRRLKPVDDESPDDLIGKFRLLLGRSLKVIRFIRHYGINKSGGANTSLTLSSQPKMILSPARKVCHSWNKRATSVRLGDCCPQSRTHRKTNCFMKRVLGIQGKSTMKDVGLRGLAAHPEIGDAAAPPPYPSRYSFGSGCGQSMGLWQRT